MKNFILTALVLLAAAAVIVAIAIPRYLAANSRSSLQPCRSNLKNIDTALEMYSTDWSGHYPESLEQLVPEYLTTIPECYSNDRGYQAVFGPDAGLNGPVPRGHGQYQDYYYVWCPGHAHKDQRLAPNFPAIDGVLGLMEEAPEYLDPAVLIQPQRPMPTPSPVVSESPTPN